tara:strand:+ start:2223 stop:3710 length:1488 start_codon:yes stop_codon:yes gene_type:complete
MNDHHRTDAGQGQGSSGSGYLDVLRARLSLAELHRDQGGQSIVYMVMVIFLLACFTFMVINSGNLLHDKLQLQSAVDSSALSGTTWVARAMNLNSMMNIFMTMLLAEEMYMKSVLWTATTAVIMGPTIESFWLGVCYTTGVCTPSTEVPIDTYELYPVLFDAQDNEDFIWDLMETLSNVEEGVHVGMTAASGAEALMMGVANGADVAVLYPPSIPEEQGELQDLCEATLDGSVGGYLESEYSMGGGLADAMAAVGGFEYNDRIRNLASGLLSNFFGKEGPLWGEMQVPYHAFWASTAPYHFTNVMFVMALRARYAVMCGGGDFGPPAVNFTIPAEWWCFFCPDNHIEIPNPYHFLGAAYSALDSSNPNVTPYMLPDDWKQRSRYYAFAYKSSADVRASFLPDVFNNDLGDNFGMLTIAQANIYNPHSEGGLFSPHWRTHLAPVELGPNALTDVAGGVLGGIGGSAGLPIDPGAAAGLVSMVGAFADSPFEDLLAH